MNKSKRWLIILVSGLILLPLLACNWVTQTFWDTADGTPPRVVISSPGPDTPLQANIETKIQSTSIDSDGIARVELYVNEALVRVDVNPTEQNAPYIVAQPWAPRVGGFYEVVVRSYDREGTAGESETLTVQVVEALLTQASTPTPTATPTGTASPPPIPTIASTPTRTDRFPTPTPTETPLVLNLPSPTPTPTVGQFDPTGLEPVGRFRDAWDIIGSGRGRLGYPLSPEVNNRDFAKQRFERGEMFWWDNADGPDYMWVIDSYATDVNSGRSWNSYTPAWPEGSVEYYNCYEALVNGEIGPRYGFGKLWCERLELQVRLGNPVEFEMGSAGNPPFAQIQFFQGGFMFYDPLTNDLLVMFNQGDWLRFVF